MTQLLQEAFWASNIPMTILLIIMLLYALLTIAGAIDMDSLDIDMDGDVDIDTDVDISGGIGGFSGFLSFLNVGKIPLMIHLFFLISIMWLISMVVNGNLNNQSLGMGLLFLFPNFFVSLILTKIVTTPFISYFKELRKKHVDADLIGELCKITVRTTQTSFGQATIFTKENIYLTINVKAIEGQDLQKGTQAILIDKVEEKGYYIVKRFEESTL
ncbi:MAG: DUF1449 family protein [Chitinophagales bacterium]